MGDPDALAVWGPKIPDGSPVHKPLYFFLVFSTHERITTGLRADRSENRNISHI